VTVLDAAARKDHEVSVVWVACSFENGMSFYYCNEFIGISLPSLGTLQNLEVVLHKNPSYQLSPLGKLFRKDRAEHEKLQPEEEF